MLSRTTKQAWAARGDRSDNSTAVRLFCLCLQRRAVRRRVTEQYFGRGAVIGRLTRIALVEPRAHLVGACLRTGQAQDEGRGAAPAHDG